MMHSHTARRAKVHIENNDAELLQELENKDINAGVFAQLVNLLDTNLLHFGFSHCAICK